MRNMEVCFLIKWVPGISGNLAVKSKLPPQSGCSLEAVEPHPKSGTIKFFFTKESITSFVHIVLKPIC